MNSKQLTLASQRARMKKTHGSAEEPKPRLISREVLELLGYRVTEDGFENQKKQMQIRRLEPSDNGSTPDFCYCTHVEKDIGFILPHPFQHYAERLPTRRRRKVLS